MVALLFRLGRREVRHVHCAAFYAFNFRGRQDFFGPHVGHIPAALPRAVQSMCATRARLLFAATAVLVGVVLPVGAAPYSTSLRGSLPAQLSSLPTANFVQAQAPRRV